MAIRHRRQCFRNIRDLRQLPRARVIPTLAGKACLSGTVVVIHEVQHPHSGVEIDVPLGLRLQYQPAQCLGRGDAQHFGRRNAYACGGVHRAGALEVYPFVDQVVRRAIAVDSLNDFLAGVEAAALGGVVLAESFEGDAEPAPLGGPVESPRKFPLTLGQASFSDMRLEVDGQAQSRLILAAQAAFRVAAVLARSSVPRLCYLTFHTSFTESNINFAANRCRCPQYASAVLHDGVAAP